MAFAENWSLQMRDPSSLIKTKFYWSAKTNKLQQTGGQETPKSTWFFKY